MAASDNDRQDERVASLLMATALIVFMTPGILALAVRVENVRPAKPDRNRIFENLKSAD
jgi:hypothetical protein